jgi:hypothetical protein
MCLSAGKYGWRGFCLLRPTRRHRCIPATPSPTQRDLYGEPKVRIRRNREMRCPPLRCEAQSYQLDDFSSASAYQAGRCRRPGIETCVIAAAEPDRALLDEVSDGLQQTSGNTKALIPSRVVDASMNPALRLSPRRTSSVRGGQPVPVFVLPVQIARISALHIAHQVRYSIGRRRLQ